MIRAAGLVVSLCIAVTSAKAQDRLSSRLDATTYATVRALIDSASDKGLPERPIEDKVLEGASAGASGPAIVVAVRTFTKRLGEASHALGRNATPDELRAGVGAIESGLPARDLVRIRGSAAGRSIATALTVTTDLVMRTVPVSTATNLMISLLKAHVKDDDIMDFDRVVRLDITNGANPANAASARAKGTIVAFGSAK